jgi:hypothetical protein
MADKKFELTDLASGKKSLLPVKSGTIGPDVLDIAAINKDHGVFTFDPGFMATASTESKITYIDGDAGVLLYRGYPIEQLAEKSASSKSCYLLLNGELPNKTAAREFNEQHPAPHDDQRIAAAHVQRFPLQRASDGDGVGASSRRCRRSTTTAWTSITRGTARSSRTASSRRSRRCGGGVQALAGPAVRLSAQRPRLLREHAAHVLRGALRAVPRRSARGRGARPAADPARRPRAERQHVHGAPGRLHRRESLCRDFGRRFGAVGPGAWRRQRSRARDAREIGTVDNIPKFLAR